MSPRPLAGALAVAAATCLLSCAPRLPFRAFHTPEIYAVLVNGGGRPSINFQSHLVHVRGVLGLLAESGVPKSHIAVFSGDGSDPAADLATRQAHGEEDFWILPRAAQRALGANIEYVNSHIDGYPLRPARRESLDAWLDGPGQELRAGDTLLFYVTDHGNINKDDLSDNTITLWKETLSVTELRGMLARLAPGVRVVMLMSQCFSGSFANAALPARGICGYFSSTADRPAYGCYPENRGVDGVGHSHHFIEALNDLGSFPEAEDRVLVTDDSPDVPHASSDFFLERTLTAAAAGDSDFDAFADRWIGRAFADRGRWEEEIRLLDRIGHTYGVFSPRSLAELEKQTEQLPEISERLGTYADLWEQALDSAAAANLRAFSDAHREWKERLKATAVKALTAEERAALRRELLAELVPFTRADEERFARMKLLHERAEKAGKAAYRMEVRLGVLLRLRTVLLQIAGRSYLAEQGSDKERSTYESLRDCESFALPLQPAHARAAELEAPPPFPPLADEKRLVEAVMPAWMGIRYRPPTPAESRDPKRSKGAVNVITVFDDSPAAAAGLRVGDIILGPPGAPFVEPNQVREWTMRREIGEPAPLRVRRGNRVLRIVLHPGPFPLEMPSLPGPPKPGSEAPELHLESFRGHVAPRPGRATVLFFWATWCAPCKASLPELLAWAAENDADVIAITDEPRDALEEFFQKFSAEFPHNVAMDPNRQAFQNYGVSGTPTFVLLGADGKVAAYETGYNAALGLRLGANAPR